MILLLACVTLGSGWTATDTEIFQPLSLEQIALAKSGDLFMLDGSGFQIIHYKNGERLSPFGGKGSGPGEFNVPVALWLRGAELLVLDLGANSISKFDLDGTFIARLTMPTRTMDIVPLANGYLYGDWRFSMNPGAPVTLNWSDLDLKNTEKLGEWERGAEANFAMEMSGGVPKVPFNPARDEFHMAVSRDGKYFAISTPGKYNITIYAASDRSPQARVSEQRALALFNEAWGQEALAAMQERADQNPFKVEFAPEFPEYFPIVREVHVTADNRLGVIFWSSDPKRKDHAVYDFQGKPSESAFPPATWDRVVAVIDGIAHVTVFDSHDEEFKIAQVAVEKVAEFVAAHPIEAEAQGNMIMIGG